MGNTVSDRKIFPGIERARGRVGLTASSSLAMLAVEDECAAPAYADDGDA